MPYTIIDGDDLVRIAMRNGFMPDSRVVAVHRDQAEYLHGMPHRSQPGQEPPHAFGVDTRTGCYSAHLLLDGFLRDYNANSARTGAGSVANARMH
jgi:hypothetical protein